ncbi:hypothetical protein KR009_007121, partial [Drosophila setifemur]
SSSTVESSMARPHLSMSPAYRRMRFKAFCLAHTPRLRRRSAPRALSPPQRSRITSSNSNSSSSSSSNSSSSSSNTSS